MALSKGAICYLPDISRESILIAKKYAVSGLGIDLLIE